MYVRRKVYSYSEPEEQLYSVTMTEDEYVLFSEFLQDLEESLYSNYMDAEGNIWRIDDKTHQKSLIAASTEGEDLVKEGTKKVSKETKAYKGAGYGNKVTKVKTTDLGVKADKKAWNKLHTKKALAEQAKQVAANKKALLDKDLIRKAHIEQGIKQGLAQGMEKGLAEGMEKGLKQGVEQGLSQAGLRRGLKNTMKTGSGKAKVIGGGLAALSLAGGAGYGAARATR